MAEGRTASAATGRRRVAVRVVAILLAPVVVAYAVLWIGGALEILTLDADAPGPTCRERSSVSSVRLGRESDRWVGGGLLWRPGVVCVVPATPPQSVDPGSPFAPEVVDEEARQLSIAEMLSLLAAAVAFIVVAITVDERLDVRRRRPDPDGTSTP